MRRSAFARAIVHEVHASAVANLPLAEFQRDVYARLRYSALLAALPRVDGEVAVFFLKSLSSCHFGAFSLDCLGYGFWNGCVASSRRNSRRDSGAERPRKERGRGKGRVEAGFGALQAMRSLPAVRDSPFG